MVSRCYRSKWRVYKDRPAISVAGRYYRVDWDTPAYPGEHPYGSRNWQDGEQQYEVDLGEVRAVKQVFCASEPPLPNPIIKVIGSPECFSDGELELPPKRWEWIKTSIEGDQFPVDFSLNWPIGSFSWPANDHCLPILVNDDTPLLANPEAVILAICVCKVILAGENIPILADEDHALEAFCPSLDTNP